jgi:hypothetical protein
MPGRARHEHVILLEALPVRHAGPGGWPGIRRGVRGGHRHLLGQHRNADHDRGDRHRDRGAGRLVRSGRCVERSGRRVERSGRPGGPWSGPGGPWGGGAPDSSGRTEYFHVASTKAAGPGAIIVTGVFTDGGIEHPGRSVDNAVFDDGTFRIDHSAGHPATSFNSKTCVGTITQTGPFRVYDGTGRFSGLQGSGTYWFAATYTTARTAAGCTTTMTAYIETINGVLTVGS